MAQTAAMSEADSFLYHVTHDLKAYLRALRVIPQWVSEDLAARDLELPEEVVDNLDLLTAYVAGMDRMLEGLTELSRVGRLSDTPADHDLCALVNDLWLRCSGADRASFSISGAGRVHGPANDLQRMISAVLDNAVRFNPASAAQVAVAIAQSGGRVRLEVSDNGPGIAPQFRDRVFEPLQTLQPKDQSGTAGMGLAVARKVATHLGGEIGISEAAGGGCLAWIDLPAA